MDDSLTMADMEINMEKNIEGLKQIVENDFQKENDCCISTNQYYFRYRAAAIIIEDGAVLMAKNDVDDHYYSVGGGVHIGETSEQAVEREVFEETGVHYEVDRLAFINECFFFGTGSLEGKECHGIEFYYLMKPRGTRELGTKDTSTEMTGTKEYMCWLPIDKLEEYKEFPVFFKQKLKHIKKEVEHIITDERVDMMDTKDH